MFLSTVYYKNFKRYRRKKFTYDKKNIEVRKIQIWNKSNYRWLRKHDHRMIKVKKNNIKYFKEV